MFLQMSLWEQTWDIETMLVQCWSTDYNAVPAQNHHAMFRRLVFTGLAYGLQRCTLQHLHSFDWQLRKHETRNQCCFNVRTSVADAGQTNNNPILASHFVLDGLSNNNVASDESHWAVDKAQVCCTSRDGNQW